MAAAPLRILVIDGNGDTLVALDTIVCNAFPGAAIATAYTGTQGIALALAEDPDVILLDIGDLVMPQMGGDGLLAAMRAQGLTTPVVILSGHPLESELAGLKERGLSGWLLKPPKIQDLALVLAQALAE
jgi:CheY-like chemotaxis protein